MKNKKGLVWHELGRWILVLAAAVLIIAFIISLSTGRLEAAISKLGELFSFGK
jgi:hypothetical protein